MADTVSSVDALDHDQPVNTGGIHEAKILSEPDRTASDHSDRSSPEPNCPICLGKLQNKSFTDSCFHTFCFTCLLEWSKVKAECPLCKQTFKSIIHNVRSLEDYDQYYINARLLETSSWQSPDGRRFRYPSTLTAERRRHLTLERILGFNAAQRNIEYNTPLHFRDVAHPSTSTFRRRVYDDGLWVRPLGNGRTTRYRDTSPEFFQQNPATTHRLVPWLNRELNVLLQNSESQVSFVLELIMALIVRFNILSPEFREHIQPYIQDRTNHFIHEFYNFARSPHHIVVYDQICVYDPLDVCLPGDQNAQSGAAVSDEIIALSPNASTTQDDSVLYIPESGRRQPKAEDRCRNRNTLRHRISMLSQQYVTRRTELLERKRKLTSVAPSRRCRRVSATRNDHAAAPPVDLESGLPGPSRIFASVSASNPPVIDKSSSDSESDCIVVGYVKPRRERTPEIVDLVSDSDSDANNNNSNNINAKASSSRVDEGDRGTSRVESKSKQVHKRRFTRRSSDRSYSPSSSSSYSPSSSSSSSPSPLRSPSSPSTSSLSQVPRSSSGLQDSPMSKHSWHKHWNLHQLDSKSDSSVLNERKSSSRSVSLNCKPFYRKSREHDYSSSSTSPERPREKRPKKRSKGAHKLRSVIAKLPQDGASSKHRSHSSSHRHQKHKKRKHHHHHHSRYHSPTPF